MNGVLNVTTNKVHKQEVGNEQYQATCGAIFYVPEERLQVTPVERALSDSTVEKCGRCFTDAGGY